MKISRIKTALALAALTITGAASNAAAEAKPLKVYILAGQSNMQDYALAEAMLEMGNR